MVAIVVNADHHREQLEAAGTPPDVSAAGRIEDGLLYTAPLVGERNPDLFKAGFDAVVSELPQPNRNTPSNLPNPVP